MSMRKRTNSRRRTLIRGFAVVAIALLLGACGNDDPTVGSGSTEAGAFNEADVTFLQDMVVHHRQAIEMAEMVETRTDRPELNELANNVITSQTAEIDEIEGLLGEAGAEMPDDMGGMDMGGSEMGMSQEEMDNLAAVEGEEFDKMFSEMMIRHHGEAIQMANDVLDEGENEDVAALAQGIIDEQQKEIDDLTSWLEEWGL